MGSLICVANLAVALRCAALDTAPRGPGPACHCAIVLLRVFGNGEFDLRYSVQVRGFDAQAALTPLLAPFNSTICITHSTHSTQPPNASSSHVSSLLHHFLRQEWSPQVRGTTACSEQAPQRPGHASVHLNRPARIETINQSICARGTSACDSSEPTLIRHCTSPPPSGKPLARTTLIERQHNFLWNCDTIQVFRGCALETLAVLRPAALRVEKIPAANNRGTMTRKTTPQPLTLPDPSMVDDEHEHDFNDSPRTPLSLKSPKSPRSPFRFNTKKSQSELPSMQAADSHQARTNLPPSQSLSSLQQFSSASGGQEKQERERPAITSFFSNYKAAKSSSRLQNSDTARPVTEDNMSRDTDHPAIAGKVSSKEATRTGTTTVSSFLFRCR